MGDAQEPESRRVFLVAIAAQCLFLVGCATKDEWPDVGNCPAPLSQKEVTRRCNQAFNTCLESHTQSIDSDTWGHSLCPICRDVCIQQQGVWPEKLWDGRPCQ